MEPIPEELQRRFTDLEENPADADIRMGILRTVTY